MATERKVFSAVHILVTFLAAAASIEIAYLHWKSIHLDNELQSMIRAHADTRKELEELATSVRIFEEVKIHKGVGEVQLEGHTKVGVQQRRMIRSLLNRLNNETIISKASATTKSDEVKEKNFTNEIDASTLLETNITGTISNNTSTIVSNTSTILNNTSTIVSNTSTITNNTSTITNNTSTITNNTSTISNITSNLVDEQIQPKQHSKSQIGTNITLVNSTEKYELLNVSSVLEAKNILELNLTAQSDHEEKKVQTDNCSSFEKGLSFKIEVKINNQGSCDCLATKKQIKSYSEDFSNPLQRPLKRPLKRPLQRALQRPRVFLPASKIIGSVGIPMEVRCNFTGGDIQKVMWQKDAGEIYGEQFFTPDNRSLVLKLHDPFMRDNGNYTCYVENRVGKDKKTIQIILAEKDCSAWKQRGFTKSGIYAINPDEESPFEIYCDMETDHRGWNVIQRREDGSVDFYRRWVDYKIGFGNLTGEFGLATKRYID